LGGEQGYRRGWINADSWHEELEAKSQELKIKKRATGSGVEGLP
jgi:hypothetical protein